MVGAAILTASSYTLGITGEANDTPIVIANVITVDLTNSSILSIIVGEYSTYLSIRGYLETSLRGFKTLVYP